MLRADIRKVLQERYMASSGLKVKIEEIVRSEMNKSGAQEVLMPMVNQKDGMRLIDGKMGKT